MQNDQIYSEIFGLVRTKDDFNLLNNELDIIKRSLSQVNHKGVSSEVRYEIVSFFDGFTDEAKEKVLEDLKRELDGFGFVEITLSGDPSQDLVDKMSIFVKQKVGQKVAIDIKVDQSLLGGAFISFDGKFFDGSVSKRLDEVLKNYA